MPNLSPMARGGETGLFGFTGCYRANPTSSQANANPGATRQRTTKMKLKTLLTATVTATLLATASMTGAASAQTADPVVQSIVTDLSAAGFSQIRIIKKASKIEVIATGPTGSLERTYSYAGDLLKEEVKPTAPAAGGAGAGMAGTDMMDSGMDDGMDSGMDDGMDSGMDDGTDGGDRDHGGTDGGERDHDGGERDHDGGERDDD